jgi:molybdopterin/thiamine biosynthesis adenylyltransferase
MSSFARYGRQIILPEVGVNGQQLLRDSSAVIVGVGGLGCVAAFYLAGAGIGRLTLIDRDRVDVTNLHRQILYTQADVGRPKVEAAAERLRALNADVELDVRVAAADADSLRGLASAADIVLDCSDNFPTRFAINAACVAARRPLVSAAAIRTEAQLALFDPARGGPCYACLFPDQGEEQERCEDAGVLGPVVGVAGSHQALLALRRLLGLGDDIGRLHLWDARLLTWRTLSIAKDTECPVCGTAEKPQ